MTIQSLQSDPNPAATAVREPDPQRLQEFTFRMVSDLGAAATAALVLLGDELGLFRAMADGTNVTSRSLAERTGTDERYVREWLSAMAASGYVHYDGSTEQFRLSPEQAAVFANSDSPVYMIGGIQGIRSMYLDHEKSVGAFRSGHGVAWGDHHDCLFSGTAKFFKPSYTHHLIQEWIPALDGTEGKLRAGAMVADVGCGFGISTILMAKEYPSSTFVGIDVHPESIEAARSNARDAGVANVRFEVGSAKTFRGEYDLVTFFDCLHDMGDPVGAMKHVNEQLADGGTVMIVEPRAGDTLEENLNPVGRLYYAFSTTICTMASKSQEVGLALGAQAGRARLDEVIRRGGFERSRVAVETPFNLVLEVK
jgi:SAM-dependent methyltransferase